MNDRKTEELAELECELRLARPARADDKDTLGAAESLDVHRRCHYEKTTGAVSKMKAGLKVELYAPAA